MKYANISDYYATCNDMSIVFGALDDAISCMMLARDEQRSGNHAAAEALLQACLQRMQHEAES